MPKMATLVRSSKKGQLWSGYAKIFSDPACSSGFSDVFSASIGPRYLPAPDFEARHLGGKQFLGHFAVHPDSMLEGHDSYHIVDENIYEKL